MTKETRTKKKRIRNPVATRAKLLQATIDLVGEKGPDALSLKEAARRANVSRGVAYLHFDDRDQLLQEAKSWISDRLREGVKQFDSSASMHERTLHTTRLVLGNPEAAKLMISSALAGKDLDPRHPLVKLVQKMLRQLKASGRVRADIDLEIMTYIMLGSIAMTVMWGQQHKGEDLDELAERFTTEWNGIILEGMFVHKPKRKAAKAAVTRKVRAKPRTAIRG